MEHLEIMLDPRCKALGVDGATFCLLRNLKVGPASPFIVERSAALRLHLLEQIDTILAAPKSSGYQETLVSMGFSATVHAGRKLTELVAKRGLRTISNVVDAYNIVAAQAAIPIGAHDVDTIAFPLRLTLAGPGLSIASFGDQGAKPVVPGTLAYLDASGAILANIGKQDRDASQHAVTASTTTVLLTLIQHRHFSAADARHALTEVVNLLRHDTPEIDFKFVDAVWEPAA